MKKLNFLVLFITGIIFFTSTNNLFGQPGYNENSPTTYTDSCGNKWVQESDGTYTLQGNGIVVYSSGGFNNNNIPIGLIYTFLDDILLSNIDPVIYFNWASFCSDYPDYCNTNNTSQNNNDCTLSCDSTEVPNYFTCQCDPRQTKDFYKDKDNDNYHSSTVRATESPGQNWKEGISSGEDCDDNDATKWEIYDGNFSTSTFTSVGTGGPVTPETPSTKDDFVYGGGNSGLPQIQPKNLIAFTHAQSGETDIIGGLNPFSDDEFWVTENLLEKTETELLNYFENALELLTIGSNANEALELLVNHFRDNTGEAYFNEGLSGIIDFGDGDGSDGRTVGNFMKSLFDEICDKLKDLEGQCVGDIDIDITHLKYPNFPLSDPNLIAQLGGIQGAGAFIDSNGNLYAEIYDTFGVSENDAIKRDSKFGNTISGGSIGTKAMRILQTHFGYRPFVHVVRINPLDLGEPNFNLNDCN